MNGLPETACPLCSRVHPREKLYDHIAAEHPRLRLSTVRVIQGYHPGWVEAHGACQPCWASFREAGRILSLLKGARLQQLGHYWNPAKIFAQDEDSDQTHSHETR